MEMLHVIIIVIHICVVSCSKVCIMLIILKYPSRNVLIYKFARQAFEQN